MASKNSEFSWVAEAASADCTTTMLMRNKKGLSVENLLAFLQKIVAENPAAAGLPIVHVEFGRLEKTTTVEVDEGRVVLS